MIWNSIKTKIYGFKECDAELYSDIYKQFGGSISTHPRVLDYLSNNYNLNIRYYFKSLLNKPVAAVFSLDGRLDYKNSEIPFVFDDLILPIKKDVEVAIPFQAKRLSPHSQRCISNGIYNPLLKKKIAHIKPHFSSKTERKRRSEAKRFREIGGAVHDISEFSSYELSELYHTLFKKRWGDKLTHIKKDVLFHVFENFRDLMFGKVIFFDGRPCAYDINYKVDCPEWIYFEDFNGGIDPEYKSLGVGSILLWENILEAKAEAALRKKGFIFSLGAFNSAWQYKKTWCDISTSGRIIF